MNPLQRTTATLLTLGLAATALVGCGSDDPADTASQAPISVAPGDEGSDGGDDAGTADPGGEDPGADILAGALAAIALAEEETGGTAFEIDDTDGGWEVEVALDARKIEVKTDLDGTEVREVEREGRLDDEDRAGLRAATITLTEAIEIAVAEAPGTFEDAELDDEGDGFAWEITLADDGIDREVYVDVDGGAVIRVEGD